MRRAPGYAFLGISCLSARLCYAAGYGQGHGMVVALRDMVPQTPQHMTPGMFAIACSASGCTAAGAQTAPPPNTGTTIGDIAMITADKVTSITKVAATGGYISAARIGRFFVAVGNRQPRSVVTVG
jgi:hypothetical protein